MSIDIYFFTYSYKKVKNFFINKMTFRLRSTEFLTQDGLASTSSKPIYNAQSIQSRSISTGVPIHKLPQVLNIMNLTLK